MRNNISWSVTKFNSLRFHILTITSTVFSTEARERMEMVGGAKEACKIVGVDRRALRKTMLVRC